MRCVFLPRHGRGHPLSPTHLNYRANIDALKRSGVTDVLSLSAVGSLKAELPPGHFVIVDQFIDRSFAREKSFFGDGIVAHVSMAHPVCSRLGDALEGAARGLGLPVTRGGTYLVMEGPQFSTKAESELYRSWGCSVIGMTNMPEAKLAREAELCYATVAMVTDFDCWHPDHDHVTVEAVVRVLLDNADKARALVQRVVPEIGSRASCARRAATVRSTTRSSPRATCATRSWWPSSMRWPGGCCSDASGTRLFSPPLAGGVGGGGAYRGPAARIACSTSCGLASAAPAPSFTAPSGCGTVTGFTSTGATPAFFRSS